MIYRLMICYHVMDKTVNTRLNLVTKSPNAIAAKSRKGISHLNVPVRMITPV